MAFFQPRVHASKSTQKVAADPALQPWVEKYRPKTIDDVTAQDHTVAVLKKTLSSANLPHMLFYGPPGTGKTSTILALARQLFGPENFRNRVLELNASDERGISVVREKIKGFARQTPRAQADRDSADAKNYPCPPYKIIILDEADSMTQDAQGALRRIMESYARITRFCLVCNYVTRIIEPLASRCSKFRFTPLGAASTNSRLSYIAKCEKIAVEPDAISALISVSSGDLRRAITYLQSAFRLSVSTQPPTKITPHDIQEIAGVVPDAVIDDFVSALGVDTMTMDSGITAQKMGGFDGIRKRVAELMREGYSASQLLSQLHDVIILHPTLTARQKAACALVFAEADKALCDGADEELWILEVALKVNKAVMS